MIFVELLENVVALVGRACLMERGTFGAGGALAAVTVNQRRKMLALEARGGGIHNHDPLNYVAQLTHIARPGIAHQHVDGVVRDLSGTPTIGRGKLFQKMTCK